MSYASVTTKREKAANSITQEPQTCYKTFDELVKRSLALKLNAQWHIDVLPDQSMLVSQRQAQYTISSFEIHVNADLILYYQSFRVPHSTGKYTLQEVFKKHGKCHFVKLDI